MPPRLKNKTDIEAFVKGWLLHPAARLTEFTEMVLADENTLLQLDKMIWLAVGSLTIEEKQDILQRMLLTLGYGISEITSGVRPETYHNEQSGTVGYEE